MAQSAREQRNEGAPPRDHGKRPQIFHFTRGRHPLALVPPMILRGPSTYILGEAISFRVRWVDTCREGHSAGQQVLLQVLGLSMPRRSVQFSTFLKKTSLLLRARTLTCVGTAAHHSTLKTVQNVKITLMLASRAYLFCFVESFS